MGFLKSLIDTSSTSSSSRAVLLLTVFVILAIHIAYNVLAMTHKAAAGYVPIDFTAQDMIVLGIVFGGKLINTAMEGKNG